MKTRDQIHRQAARIWGRSLTLASNRAAAIEPHTRGERRLIHAWGSPAAEDALKRHHTRFARALKAARTLLAITTR